ncbi:MAG: efflux RND transporter permease subunit [Saprospiraceae bacterium]
MNRSKSLPRRHQYLPLPRPLGIGRQDHQHREKEFVGRRAIVILVLILLLGDLRAGLIVASVIPLAMLFALILMSYFGVSANLMSLGAIDFGIVIDGAVIIVEGVLHGLFTYHVGKQLTQTEMDGIITESSAKLFRSAVFGVFIILVVFVPIMTLTGIEGKMFRPMAMTFSFAVLGALVLSLTYVPAVSALVLSKNISAHQTFADKIMDLPKRLYEPVLQFFAEILRPRFVGGRHLFDCFFLGFSNPRFVFIPYTGRG